MNTTTLIQWLAACVMMASALIVVKGNQTPPVLVLDENREVALLSDLERGTDASYTRCKTVLVNVGAVLASTWPFEEDGRARHYLETQVTQSELVDRLWQYRQKLTVRRKTPIDRVLLRTERNQRIQIFRRGDRQGFVANITFTPVSEDLERLFDFSFDVQLVKTAVTPMNPMGYALNRCKPLDRFWED